MGAIPTIYFTYGPEEIAVLSTKDKKLAAAIKEIGMIRREVTPDLFTALVHSIIGQQISTKAANTIREKLNQKLTAVTPQSITDETPEEIQSCGMTMKKAVYIQTVAQKILSGEFDLEKLKTMADEEICKCLSELPGVGKWTAEMLLIFSMQRPDVLSFDDLGIQRGLRMLYRHKKITKELFAKYKQRYSPYASVASLYLWAVAGGACSDLKDNAVTDKNKSQKAKTAVRRQA